MKTLLLLLSVLVSAQLFAQGEPNLSNNDVEFFVETDLYYYAIRDWKEETETDGETTNADDRFFDAETGALPLKFLIFYDPNWLAQISSNTLGLGYFLQPGVELGVRLRYETSHRRKSDTENRYFLLSVLLKRYQRFNKTSGLEYGLEVAPLIRGTEKDASSNNKIEKGYQLETEFFNSYWMTKRLQILSGVLFSQKRIESSGDEGESYTRVEINRAFYFLPLRLRFLL